MEIMQEGNLPSVDSLDFVRGLNGGNSIKILPSALLKNAGALLQTSLPASGVNVVGNYDGNISGYGWYNNSADPTGTYAPPSSAGIFIRINLSSTQVTFFFPTVVGKKKLWYRIDGGACIEL